MAFETRLTHSANGYSYEWRETGFKWWEYVFCDRRLFWTPSGSYHKELASAKSEVLSETEKMNTPYIILDC